MPSVRQGQRPNKTAMSICWLRDILLSAMLVSASVAEEPSRLRAG
jgi:hypothetical protein